MTQVEVVHELYAAFARGDVPAILAHLAEDVEWEYGASTTNVPWLQPLRGRDAVPRFFEVLGRELEFHRFEPKAFLSGDDVVAVLLDLEATVRRTGRRIVEEDEVHLWRFRDGRIARFRHRLDSHAHQLAYGG